MEFLPWTESKALDLVRSGQTTEVVRAYEAGFRVPNTIIAELLMLGDLPSANYFLSKGLPCGSTVNPWNHAVQNKHVNVMAWILEHCTDTTAAESPYLQYYRAHGIGCVGELLEADIHPSAYEYIFISQDDDKCVELMLWLKQHGCCVHSSSETLRIAKGNAQAGGKVQMLAFLNGI